MFSYFILQYICELKTLNILMKILSKNQIQIANISSGIPTITDTCFKDMCSPIHTINAHTLQTNDLKAINFHSEDCLNAFSITYNQHQPTVLRDNRRALREDLQNKPNNPISSLHIKHCEGSQKDYTVHHCIETTSVLYREVSLHCI